jgi:F-box protein 42
MIVFGGSHGQGSRTNDVWVLDLVEFTWTRRDIAGRQPNPRYGQTQTVLDDLHILVIGGCGGANMLFR